MSNADTRHKNVNVAIHITFKTHSRILIKLMELKFVIFKWQNNSKDIKDVSQSHKFICDHKTNETHITKTFCNFTLFLLLFVFSSSNLFQHRMQNSTQTVI